MYKIIDSITDIGDAYFNSVSPYEVPKIASLTDASHTVNWFLESEQKFPADSRDEALKNLVYVTAQKSKFSSYQNEEIDRNISIICPIHNISKAYIAKIASHIEAMKPILTEPVEYCLLPELSMFKYAEDTSYASVAAKFMENADKIEIKYRAAAAKNLIKAFPSEKHDSIVKMYAGARWGDCNMIQGHLLVRQDCVTDERIKALYGAIIKGVVSVGAPVMKNNKDLHTLLKAIFRIDEVAGLYDEFYRGQVVNPYFIVYNQDKALPKINITTDRSLTKTVGDAKLAMFTNAKGELDMTLVETYAKG